ncbi:hypothetical protein L3X38_012639 [Prunus dulcis]|uniref:Uncharacterized protein n=1 Tax=Prunus dulcis TaxID=3755 RepID=A0AAD4WMH0_PRUDU|nr:hypothetical protein L3X38_012639 [Prunus dulcis]
MSEERRRPIPLGFDPSLRLGDNPFKRLSFTLCAKRATDFQKVLAPPPSSNGHGTGGVGTGIESPTFSNRPQP